MDQAQQPAVDPTAEPKRRSTWRRNLTNLGIVLLAPLFAILLTTFVFQSYQVSGMSMQNSLQDGDRLIVWKGSRTWARLFGEQYVPNRGDIVIVNQQDLSACEQTGKIIVKRVIGLPGERVVYADGQYTVYTADHPNGFNPDTTLPYGKSGTPLLTNPGSSKVDVTLSSTQLFVSGDHRNSSCDSRAFGPIDANQIIGKVAARVYPVSHAEAF